MDILSQLLMGLSVALEPVNPVEVAVAIAVPAVKVDLSAIVPTPPCGVFTVVPTSVP